MKDFNRSEAIAWCKDNQCDFITPIFPPPEGWAWCNNNDGLALQPIFTITDQGEEITKTHVSESIYCPVCGRYIDPSNVQEVENGEMKNKHRKGWKEKNHDNQQPIMDAFILIRGASMTYLLLIYIGGLIPASERAYEDWNSNLMPWEEAIISAILWPVLTVVWVWYMWRKS